MKRVYLDHNATSPMGPEVRERWMEVAESLGGNPSSLHEGGRRARDWIDRSRESVAQALGVHEDELIFTSGGTESNNMALHGVLAADRGRALVTGSTEHSSVLEPAQRWAAAGNPLTLLPVDRSGSIDLERLARALGPATALISLQAANNEVGTLTPLAEVARIARSTGAPAPLIHTDAVQALGRVPVDLAAWGADSASFSAHKVGGPVGVGLFWRRRGVRLEPLVHGGGHEAGLRAGTEDVAGIAAAALAIERAVRGQARFAQRVRAQVSELWHELCTSVPGLRLVGPALDSQERLPNTLSFLVPESDGKVLVTRLDLEGVAIGAGSACASGSLEPSHVLTAMGYGEDESRAGLRLSLGAHTTRADCRFCVDVFRKLFATSRAS